MARTGEQRRRFRVLAAAGVAAVGSFVASCARAPAAGDVRSVGPRPTATQALTGATNPGHADVVSPVIRGGEDGLELVWFLARDDGSGTGTLDGSAVGAGGAVLAALAPYAQRTPITEDMRSGLARAGLRLVRVPLSDVPGVEASLVRVGPRNRDWLGWALEWREAFRGASVRHDAAVTIDGARALLPEGVLRVLARAWTAPTASPPSTTTEGRVPAVRPTVRLELAVQLQEASRVAASDLSRGFDEPDAVLDPRREGRVFAGAMIDTHLEPGWAYVLTAQRAGPDVANQQAGARDAGSDRGEDSGLRFEKPSGRAGTGPEGVLGPRASTPPTVGEAMLTNVIRAEGEPPVKAVLIFIPRTPKSFDLLAR